MSIDRRLVAAPISWGVCEAPGWGHEMSSPRVLEEMHGLGFARTELGPTGYLGATPVEVIDSLASHQLALVGGFLPVVMHSDIDADLSESADAMATLAQAGAEVVVLAARSVDGSYDNKVRITDAQWPVLLSNLDRLQQLAKANNLLATLHPHVGTAIEDRDCVVRLLESSEIALCLDTGHLLIGGMEPMELLESWAHRVAHVHLKDVRAAVAATVRSGEVSYLSAVRGGLYTPLGSGDVDIASIVRTLEAVGYSGYYVLEEDCALDEEPAAAGGPVLNVQRSLDFLAAIDG